MSFFRFLTVFAVAGSVCLLAGAGESRAETMAAPASQSAAQDPMASLTMEQRLKYVDWNNDLTDTADKYSGVSKFVEDCNGPIVVKLDPAVVESFMNENASAAGFCEEVVYAMASLCKHNETWKQTLKDKVNSLHCTYQEGEVAVDDFSLSNGQLTFPMNPEVYNISDKTEEFLKSAL